MKTLDLKISRVTLIAIVWWSSTSFANDTQYDMPDMIHVGGEAPVGTSEADIDNLPKLSLLPGFESKNVQTAEQKEKPELTPPSSKNSPDNARTGDVETPAKKNKTANNTESQTDDWKKETAQCRREASRALSSCEDRQSDVQSRVSALERNSSSLSSKTAVACGQLARDATSVTDSSVGKSCSDQVRECRNSCGFANKVKNNDVSSATAKDAYDDCERAARASSGIARLLDQAGRVANEMNNCYQSLGGPNLFQSPQQTAQNSNPMANWQNQQRDLQQAACLTNPAGCGMGQQQPFAPTNMQPAGLPSDDLARNAAEHVGGPGDIRLPFDGSKMIEETLAARRGGRAGDGAPPMGSQKPANVASDFRQGNSDSQKPKRNNASPAEKVGAEIYRGYLNATSGGETSQGRTSVAEARTQANGRPQVGARAVLPPGGLAKFAGKAQELRQIWSEKLRAANMQRGIAGAEYRGFVPVGADGLTGPHAENFKKIRGRYMFLERTLSK